MKNDDHYPNAMINEWSPSAIIYKCHLSSCGDLESYDGLQIM
jgi:hypothetical protein